MNTRFTKLKRNKSKAKAQLSALEGLAKSTLPSGTNKTLVMNFKELGLGLFSVYISIGVFVASISIFGVCRYN